MLYSKEAALKLAIPVAVTETSKLPSVLLPWHDIAKLREMTGLEMDRSSIGEPNPDVEEFDMEVCFRDGHKMPARIYRPRQVLSTGFPVLVHYHASGWVTGSYLQAAVNMRRLANALDLVVISLPYRLAPEHKFPIPQFDAYDGLKWTIDNSHVLGFNANQGFIIAGASAGGQLAAVCAQQWLHSQEKPRITGMYLDIPWILAQDQVPQQYLEYYNSPYQEEMKDAPIFNSDGYKLIDEYLQPDYKSAWHSPFMAVNPHVEMPPVYLQVSGRDPLRDHALIYEDALRSAGVKTRLDIYPGLFHSFPGVLPTLPETTKFLKDQIKGIAFLLGREESNPKATL